ncbi:MAG: hypothetical protein ACR2NR_09925 [Solirubrobacteraceae bacterium]
MSFLRGAGRTTADPGSGGPAVKAFVEQRRSIRSDRLCAGTLACSHCDAPVALGAGSHSLTDRLRCPFCGHRAPARDFLSLAIPTRPARVTVRVSYSAIQSPRER